MDPRSGFSTVVIDPPWPMKQGFNGWGKRSTLPYKSMTINAIAALSIGSVVRREGYVFVWVTNNHLPSVFSIIAQWGLLFRQMITWAKPIDRHGLGGMFGSNTEHVVIAQRIKANTNAHGRRTHGHREPTSWFSWPVRRHSEKPVEFYDTVELCAPGPYLDIFARRERVGWTCIGDEIDGRDINVSLDAICKTDQLALIR